ncbi:hypothetical protein UK99_02630 [Frankia casuarinae]|jgi:hypothetical protein|nr:hypothetical protein KBI5_07645 [Frankia sp. KB5]ORT98175.1 hypothetical protein UK99_02630 [Frankia casuarinae]
MRYAVVAGCDVATVTTQPGSKSQQNTQRAGFDLLHTRAILNARRCWRASPRLSGQPWRRPVAETAGAGWRC